MLYDFSSKMDELKRPELGVSISLLDEDEFLRVHKMPLEQAVELVLSGKITDAKTQIALLKAKAILKNG